MTPPASPRLQEDLALARAVRARALGDWRPSWGRIIAIAFSLGFWGLVGWALAALFGGAS